MKEEIKVLLVEDSFEDRINFQRNISKLNNRSQAIFVEYEESSTLEQAIDLLERVNFDLVLLDLSLPDSSGLEGLSRLKFIHGFGLPIILLTGDESEKLALEAIKKGAQDYLQKNELSPFNLGRSIMYALERTRTARQIEELRIQQVKSLKMATLGEMAGGIAHEINTPLTVILGYADMLKRVKSRNFGDDDYINFGEKITTVTNRIAKIVKSFKAYSRQEDKDPMELVKLSDIVEDTLNLCSEKFEMSSIDLIVDDIVDVEIFCKDVQLSQVLLNLFNNAYDAIRSKDERWVRLHSQLEDSFLALYVEDSGEKLDDRVKRNIFQPFFTTKEKGVGTGLGMSISRSIIESHDGRIELLDSSRHTTFKITLPLAIQHKKRA